MKHVQTMLCVAAISMIAAACDSPASSQETAIEATQEAQQAAAAAQREAAEKITAAQAEANATALEARDEAARAAERAQAEATEAVGDANAALIKARGNLRDWSHSRLESIDRDMDRARADAANESAEVQTNFNEVMRDVEARRSSIQNQLATLESRSAQGWDQFKTDFEARVDALEARLKDARARL